jgi:hypothetical protein
MRALILEKFLGPVLGNHMSNQKKHQAALLVLSLKLELEDCGHDLAMIQGPIKQWCKRGMHGKRMVSLIVVTNETICELGERLRPFVERANAVENFHACPERTTVRN